VSHTVVTGASGVVGGAVVRHLVAGGHAVIATSRSDDSDRVVSGLGASPVRADILDPSTLVRAMAGADVVYHVAGVNEMCGRRPDTMVRANVLGSLNTVRAARAAGVRRVVYTSSAAALGEPEGAVGDESSAHRGWYLSEYERSKRLAERAVLSERGIDVVAVCPSSVQGPGRATGTARLILDVLTGRLPALVDTRLSIVDIDDCARGHLLAAELGVTGERYLLNSFTLRTREAVDLLQRIAGTSIRVRYLPGWLASAAGAAIEAACRLGGRQPPICREMVRTMRHGHSYDGSKATRDLGLQYSSAEETLRRVVEWFRDQGMVP
jgi:dihydroflavonol-4-reductase